MAFLNSHGARVLVAASSGSFQSFSALPPPALADDEGKVAAMTR